MNEIFKAASGTYFDPTATITANSSEKIKVYSSQGELIGETKSNVLSFKLLNVGYDRFHGTVTFNGIEADHTVTYDRKMQRLTFSNDLISSIWYIEKRE